MKPSSERITIRLDQANFDRAANLACKEAAVRLCHEFDESTDTIEVTFLDYTSTRKGKLWRHSYRFEAYVDSLEVDSNPAPPRVIVPAICPPLPLGFCG